jgi:hypothetical protein
MRDTSPCQVFGVAEVLVEVSSRLIHMYVYFHRFDKVLEKTTNLYIGMQVTTTGLHMRINFRIY